jgi:hypothetical protein
LLANGHWVSQALTGVWGGLLHWEVPRPPELPVLGYLDSRKKTEVGLGRQLCGEFKPQYRPKEQNNPVVIAVWRVGTS